MPTLEDIWLEKHGAKAPASAAPSTAPQAAPKNGLEAIWLEKHGQAPAQSSTALEQQAVQQKRAGVSLGDVNTAYLGEYGKPAARGHLSPQQQYQHLISIGASPNEAHFLTSAAASESNLNPFARHDNNTGYGLYGHRLDRLESMRKFAGTEFPEWQQQNAFALNELRQRPEWKRVANAKDARDLAVAQMYYERPLGFTEENPTAGHNFAGRLTTLNRFAGLRGDQRIARGELAPEWGAGHAVMTGATLGAAPAMQAGFETGYAPLPFGQGFPAANRPAYQARVAELEQQRRLYNQENPLTGYGLEGIGSVAATAVPFTKAGQVLGRTIEAVAPAVPAVQPYVSPAMRFLSGEAGQAIPQVAPRMEGAAGVATRIGSAGAQGATQGIAQTGVEALSRAMGGSLGDEETPLLQQFGTSALLGGGLGAALSKVVSPRAGGALAPAWEQETRRLGQSAIEQFNIPVHPGQFAQGKAREFFEKTAPQTLLDEQNKRFSQEAAKFIGEEKLTPEAIAHAKQEFGTAMDTAVASIPNLRLTPTANRELTRLYNEADRTLRSKPARKAVQGLIMDITNDFASGAFNGKLYRSYTQTEGGEISRLLSETSNEIRQHYGKQLNKIMEDILKANDPVAFDQVKKLQSWYRDIKTLEPHATTSGIANPKAIASAVASEGSRSNLAKLAPIGEFLQATKPSGEAARLPGREKPENFIEWARQHWQPLAAGASFLAPSTPLVGGMLGVTAPFFQYAIPGLYAGTQAVKQITKQKLKSGAVRRRVFHETYGPEQRMATRPMVRGAVTLNPLYNQESEQ
jgi:hypothetical protein